MSARQDGEELPDRASCDLARRTCTLGYPLIVCRNIRPLFNFEPPATDDEIHAAALQYVRKVSGSTRPSQANEALFAAAVEEIAAATRRLVHGLATTAPPRDRAVEAAKAKIRNIRRFGGANG